MPENCAAIVIAAKHHELTKVKDTRGTTHTIGALRCKFEFRTNDWLNSAKTAMFCNGDAILHPEVIDNAIAVPLGSDDECPVPYEVLTDTLPYSIGVWGVTNNGLRIVSKWLVFDAQQGCYTEGNAPEDPEPTIYEQILGIAQGAVNTANKVLSSAENGEFDGVSVTHSWDGSVLTLNSASGTTSTDLVGPQGNGIAYITKTSTDGLVDTYIITYTDGTTTSFTVTNGKDGEPGYTPQKDVDYFDGKDGGYYVPHLQSDGTLIFAPSDSDMRPIGSVGNIKGADGKGIASIVRTSGNGEAGTIDTYTITYTDNTESTFSIYNGKDGEEGKSAYKYAQDGGYEGSEEDFAKKLAKEEITPDWVATKTAVAGEAVFIPQQTLTSGMWSNLQANLRAGYGYDVVFNGKVYTCISNIEDGGVYLGNVTLMDSSSTNTHNNEPFCIYWAGAGATSGFFYKDSTVSYPIDLKVTNHGGYEYDKMPKEYLPDEVALKTDIPEQVQADLAQHDPEAPDYVKNRLSIQGDWNIFDSQMFGHIKNRTHYLEYTIDEGSYVEASYTAGSACNCRSTMYNWLYDGKEPLENVFFFAFVNDELVKLDTIINYVGYQDAIIDVFKMCGNSNMALSPPRVDRKTGKKSLRVDSTATKDFTLRYGYAYPSGVKTLDEKYIPDTIARVADIENTYALKTDLENVSVDLSAYETTEAAQAKLDEAKAYTDEAMASISIESITLDEIDEICGPNMTDDNDGNVAVVSVFNDQRVSYNNGNVSVESIFNDNDVTFDDEGNVTIGGL